MNEATIYYESVFYERSWSILIVFDWFCSKLTFLNLFWLVLIVHDRSKVKNNFKKLCSDHTQRPSVSDEKVGGLCRLEQASIVAGAFVNFSRSQPHIRRRLDRHRQRAAAADCAFVFTLQSALSALRVHGASGWKRHVHFKVTSFTVFSTTKSDNDTTTKKPSVGLRLRRPPPPPTRSLNTPSCRVWQ